MAKFCCDCRYSTLQNKRMLCRHPKVLRKYPEQLAKSSPVGVPCLDQRKLSMFQPCGLSGKLWIKKSPNDYELDRIMKICC